MNLVFAKELVETMGQIESKDGDNTTNDLSDRKGIIGKGRGSTTSSNLNIKIDDNSDRNKESNDENDNQKDAEKDKILKKAKTYDFACTVFYAMVALLVFSTMSRTYTNYSGGGCGALYGAQPILAYSCVGLACAIIKSLRKQIKGEIKENSDEPDKENNVGDLDVDTNGGHTYEVSTITSKEKLNNEMNFPNDTKLVLFPALPAKDALIVNIPEPLLNVNKLSNGLPFPPPPPSNLLMKKKVSFQTPNELSPLSAVDLKVAETDIEKEKNWINETHGQDHGSDPFIFKNDWKDIKFDTEMFKHRDRDRDSHQPIEYNWNDYNLNVIDKY